VNPGETHAGGVRGELAVQQQAWPGGAIDRLRVANEFLTLESPI